MHRHDWPAYLPQQRTNSPQAPFESIFDPTATFAADHALPPDNSPQPNPQDSLSLSESLQHNSIHPVTTPLLTPTTNPLPVVTSSLLTPPTTGPLQPTTRDNFGPPPLPRRAPVHAPRPPPFIMPPDADQFSPAQRRELRRQLRRARGVNRRARIRTTCADLPTSLDPARINAADRVAERRRSITADGVDKKTARVIRNREVALRARQAAKAKLHNLQSENLSLRTRASNLEDENSTLKRQIESLRRGATTPLWQTSEATMEGVAHSLNR